MRIALTGTPGTGKTSVAKKLGLEITDLAKAIKKNKLYSKYDKGMKSYIADMRKLKRFLKSKDNVIFDGHISHLVPVDLVVVLRCKPSVLEKRLKKRGYYKRKICVNVESELIGIISYQARKKSCKVFEVDTTKLTIKQTVSIVKKIIKSPRKCRKYCKIVDWCKKI